MLDTFETPSSGRTTATERCTWSLTSRFLEAFFRHAVLGESHELTRDKLMCREMFEHPKALRNATQADALAVRRYLAEMER